MPSDGNRPPSDREPAAEPLNAFWNAVVGGSAPRPGDLEPEFAETILRLHTAASVPGLSATRQAQIWSELVAGWPAGSYPQTIPPLPQQSPNGHGGPGADHGISARPARRVWLVPQLATVALVLLALLGSVVAFRVPLPLVGLVQHPAIMPAIDATADAVLPPGVIADTVLLHGTFEAIPPGAAWEGIERTTLAPGAEWPLGKSQNDGEGPWLYRVESGELTITADGPITITRAGAAQSTTIAPGTDVVILAGDQGFTPSGVTSRWRNDGQIPAVVMDAGITTVGSEMRPGGVVHLELVERITDKAPKAPVQVEVRRLILSAKAALSIDSLPGSELAYVESGQVVVVDPASAATTANPLDTTSNTVSLPTPSAPYALQELRPGRVLQVRGSDSATILLMTIREARLPDPTPVDNQADMATPSVNLPGGATEDTVLMQGTFAEIPQHASWQGIARAILPPDVEWSLGKSENDGEGPLLYHVEFGELTVNADEPIQVRRAGTSQPITIPPGQDVVLQKGDQGYTPSGVTSRWRNARQVPVVVLDAGFSTSGYGALPDGVTDDPVAWTYASRPKGPVAVSVRRVTLPAGAVLAASDLPGLQLLYVESGSIEVVDVKHLTTTANPLSNAPPDKAAQTIGVGSFFSAADHAGNAVRVTKSDSATLLMMTVIDAQSGEAPPMR
jgi:hypothetical protein